MTNNVRNKVFATPYGLVSLAVVAEWAKEHFTNEAWVYEVAISASSSDACDAPARTVLYQFVDTVHNYEQCIDLTPDRLLEVLEQFCNETSANWEPNSAGLLAEIDSARLWRHLSNWCREQMEEQKERNA